MIRPIRPSRISATTPAASPIATASKVIQTTRRLIPVACWGISSDSSAGPIDGASGKPSVDDDPLTVWSITLADFGDA